MSGAGVVHGPVVVVGAGRMGRGIAHVFAYAGRPVTVLDMKARPEADFLQLAVAVSREIETGMRFLASVDVMSEGQVRHAMGLVNVRGADSAAEVLAGSGLIVECVPETRAAKTEALGRIGALAPHDAPVLSTTSTILVTELQSLIAAPERFLNTHFLNPAYLIPLVEVSPGPDTEEVVTARVMALLESVGKVPVRCAPTPGYIVPRLQALIMSEACRMVAAGVATPAELDRAIMNGLGPRFAAMGVLEFVDWGGVDILYRAGNYLAKALDSPAHAPPPEVDRMICDGHTGMREGKGYYDYGGMDLAAYQQTKLKRFVDLLRSIGQLGPPGVAD